jgi:hypothetical protein
MSSSDDGWEYRVLAVRGMYSNLSRRQNPLKSKEQHAAFLALYKFKMSASDIRA